MKSDEEILKAIEKEMYKSWVVNPWLKDRLLKIIKITKENLE